MTTSAITTRFGNRGGGWATTPDERAAERIADSARCSVCAAPMTCDQPGRHWSCSPECAGCHRPYGPGRHRSNCRCKASDTTGKDTNR